MTRRRSVPSASDTAATGAKYLADDDDSDFQSVATFRLAARTAVVTTAREGMFGQGWDDVAKPASSTPGTR